MINRKQQEESFTLVVAYDTPSLNVYREKYLGEAELAAATLEFRGLASSFCVLEAEAGFSSSLSVYNTR